MSRARPSPASAAFVEFASLAENEGLTIVFGQDENFGRKLRQEYTDMARSGSADELTNLAFFNLIIDK